MKEQNVQTEDSVEKQGMCFDTLITLYLEVNVIYNDQGVIILFESEYGKEVVASIVRNCVSIPTLSPNSAEGYNFSVSDFDLAIVDALQS